MVKALLGGAWKEGVKDNPAREYYSLRLDLGILGVLGCRIVANDRRKVEAGPDWLIFHTPPTGGDDLQIGAMWKYRNPDSGAEYPTGRIQLSTLGMVELKGGAKVDLRLTAGEIPVKLTEVRVRKNERTPTHQLWRMEHIPKVQEGGDQVPAVVAAPPIDPGDAAPNVDIDAA